MPDLQYQCLNFSSDSLKDGLHRWPGFTFIFSVCRPKSRGEITLRDAEGRVPPRILANYLTDPDDMRVMQAGFKIARQIAAPASRKHRRSTVRTHPARPDQVPFTGEILPQPHLPASCSHADGDRSMPVVGLLSGSGL